MKRFLRIAIVFFAAATVLFVAAHFTRAQVKAGKHGRTNVPSVLPATIPPAIPGLPHFLAASYMTQGYPETPASMNGGTWYPEESNPLSFKCVVPCTLEIQNSVNLYTPDYEGYDDDYWLETWVDGTLAPINGDIATIPYEGSVQGTLDQFLCLKPGIHTVWTEVKSDEDSELYWWENNYRVYAP